jgi:hypothetical protein
MLTTSSVSPVHGLNASRTGGNEGNSLKQATVEFEIAGKKTGAQFAQGKTQLPSSSVAAGLKFEARGCVHPNTSKGSHTPSASMSKMQVPEQEKP